MENNTNGEHHFFFAYTIVLLAIVFIGFTPSIFLRHAFDTPPIPFYLHLHGAILTGWFVAQAWLIYAKNPALGSGITYLTFITAVIWNNITSVCTFAILLIAAIFFRSSPDIYKRLFLVASVGIIGLALARISRLEIHGGE